MCFSEKESESECESYIETESERISMFKDATRLCMYTSVCLNKQIYGYASMCVSVRAFV